MTGFDQVGQNGPSTRSLDKHRQGFGAMHYGAAEEPAATAAEQGYQPPHRRDPTETLACTPDYANQKTMRCHRIDSTDRPAHNRARGRLMLAATVFACALTGVAAQLVNVALSDAPNAKRIASPLEGDFRADITDRNGVLIATQVQTASLYADPAKVLDPVMTAEKIASVIEGTDADRLAKNLTRDTRFMWIKRHLTPEQHAAVHRLGLPGVGVRDETRRFYPQGNSMAHILGFTSIDNEGLAGVEQAFDDRLREREEPLKLTVDTRVQAVLRERLADAMAEFSAVGATGVVLDAKTGDVVAMSSLPDFNPMRPAEAPSDHRFNRAVQGVYELGSTFKIFTTAMALDSGRVSMRDGVDATDPIRVGRFTINDFHPQERWLSVPEIFMYSSNIGTAKLAMSVGTEGQRRFLSNLGLTQRAAVELPEAANPLVPRTWRDVNTMTISYGHGIAVTPLHLVGAVGAMVNGGVYNPPTLVADHDHEKTTRAPSHRIVSPETSANIRKLMRLVVEHGTGGRAEAQGYLVGGKTGTAEKPKDGRYAERSLISSFVAAFPMHDPQYVVLATLDEPRGTKDTFGYATGGWVAAPVVAKIISEMAPILGLAPMSADDPKIRQALDIRFDRPVIENPTPAPNPPTPYRGTTLASY
ncbi:MAG: penicillin-binding protein 2 [Alphaproteobacteria bacterium]|nr:penicillin-binding protein 2 [Alphaproteobacteria bacterium SS10]